MNQFIAAFVLASLAMPAAAQGSHQWSAARGDGFVAAGACGSSPGSCVRLQCLAMEGGGIHWMVDAPDPGHSAESASVTMTVDGVAVTLAMNKAGPPDGRVQSYDAEFRPGAHQDLLQRLKAGNRLRVASDQFRAFDLSLRGSGAALAVLQDECPLAGIAEAASEGAGRDALAVDPGATELAVTAAQLPRPVQDEIGDIAAMCGQAFLTEGRSPEALLAEDIDGDGVYDFLLDHAQFCPDAILTMCGASHCPMTLFVSGNGAWQQFDFILQGYSEFTEKGFLLQCEDPGRKAGVFMEDGKLVRRNC